MATYNVLGPNTGLLDSIIDYFSCEEASGNRLTQTYTGNYLAPSNTVAQEIPGKSGDGVQLLGSSTNGNQGKLVSSSSYNLDAAFSIAFWINVQQPGSGIAWNAVTFNDQIAMQTIENIALGLSYNVIYNGTNYGASAGTFNAWQHVVITVTSTAVKFYLNGTLTMNQAVTAPTFGKIPLTIQGCNQAANTTEFDEIGLWQRVLDSTEVSTLYNSGSGDFWSFGGTFFDISGVVSGGHATTNFDVAATGGAVCGGHGPINYDLAGTGGAIGGGSASVSLVHTQVTTGGAVCGGAALAAFGFFGSGGAVAGGHESDQMTYGPVTSGGALAGGAAIQTIVINSIITSGGAIVSGASLPIEDEDPIASGGAIAGGLAEVIGPIVVIPSGGAVAAGQAILQLTFVNVATGGAVVVPAQFSNGFALRVEIDLDGPAKLTGDALGHVWPLSFTVDPSTVYYMQVGMTDFSGNILPSQLVSYHNGMFKLDFRADAFADRVNRYFAYWR